MNFIKIGTLSFVLFASTLGFAQSSRNVAEYNLQKGLALKGVDPVSYYAEGGGKFQSGLSDFKLDFDGTTYLFSNKNNLDQFLENHEKYEPTYGGWCAYAMSYNSKVDIQPQFYTFSGSRLHLFASRRAKQNFDVDLKNKEIQADQNWKRISGEEPRLQ